MTDGNDRQVDIVNERENPFRDRKSRETIVSRALQGRIQVGDFEIWIPTDRLELKMNETLKNAYISSSR